MTTSTTAPSRAAVLDAAEALWHADHADCDPQWRQSTWDDMGGSEPTEERVAYEMRARAELIAAGNNAADASRED